MVTALPDARMGLCRMEGRWLFIVGGRCCAFAGGEEGACTSPLLLLLRQLLGRRGEQCWAVQQNAAKQHPQCSPVFFLLLRGLAIATNNQHTMRAPTHLCHLLAQQAASALRASQVCGPAAPAALQALPASSQDWARALASLSTSTASTSSAASPSWSSSAVPHGSSRSRPGRPPAWRMLHTSAPAAHGGGDGPISDET